MSLRSALVAVSLSALAACTAATVAAHPGHVRPQVSTAAEVPSTQGGTGQAMVMGSRASVSTSRDSSRQALAAAAGQEVTPESSSQAREANAAIAKLAASAEETAKKLAKDAWQLPVTRGVYRLTAEFGQCSGLWAHCHTGLDFAAPSGTPIHSVAGGVVTGLGWAGAYGNRTVVTLNDGTETWYCHQSEFGVKEGDNVFAGQVIGRVGATGNTTGPHLHLEVRPGGGDAVDPADALSFHGATP